MGAAPGPDRVLAQYPSFSSRAPELTLESSFTSQWGKKGVREEELDWS